MSKKLDPTIIRVGDIVKVINPLAFVRCGYPMSLKDSEKEVEELFGNHVELLCQSVQRGDIMLPSSKINFLNYIDNWKKDKSSRRILKELAYLRLRHKSFGGSERKIFTEIVEDIRGRKYKVSQIFFCKTGTYHSGYAGYSYEGEWDSEPAYLEDEKTHKILRLCTLCLAEMKDNDLDYNFNLELTKQFNLRVESINVEKVADENMSDNVKGLAG